jgi:phosphomannomutase/phosphoglucomutase
LFVKLQGSTMSVIRNRAAFKDCDVRGKYPEDVDEVIFRHAGFAFGRQIRQRTVATPANNVILVGGDHRFSTPALKENFLAGLCAHDLKIIDLGVVPTPVVYWAKVECNAQACAVITASHNPPEFNGLKIMNGECPPTPKDIQDLAEDHEDDPKQVQCPAEKITFWPDCIQAYQHYLISEFNSKKIDSLTIAVDAGNGCQAGIASEVFARLGAHVISINNHRDGLFKDRHPDCAIPENLTALISSVKKTKAQLGIAFDGDGDRLAVVDDKSRILGSERLGMILLQGPLRPEPDAAVILDIKCSMQLERIAKKLKGLPIRCKSGHAYMKRMVIERQAIVGVELSGHIFLRSLMGRDDPLYTALILGAHLAQESKPLSALVDELPPIYMTPDIRVPMPSENIDRIIKTCRKGLDGAEVETLDGVRLIWKGGWLLVRRSITEPKITIRMEGDGIDNLKTIAGLFSEAFPQLAAAVTAAVDKVVLS